MQSPRGCCVDAVGMIPEGFPLLSMQPQVLPVLFRNDLRSIHSSPCLLSRTITTGSKPRSLSCTSWTVCCIRCWKFKNECHPQMKALQGPLTAFLQPTQRGHPTISYVLQRGHKLICKSETLCMWSPVSPPWNLLECYA